MPPSILNFARKLAQSPQPQSKNGPEDKNFLSETSLALEKQKLGWIGKLFGADKEKAGNIACISIVFSLLLIPAIIFIPMKDESISKDRLLLIPSNIITLSLGYLFGKR